MELVKRKSNRLKEFDYSSAGYYFITVCTKDKQKILCDIDDNNSVGGGAHDAPQVILSDYGKIVQKYILSTKNIKGISVDKYVIMPNHIHGIFVVDENYGTSRAPSPTNNAVSLAVGAIKRLVNKEIGTNIWQRSFHDHIIRNEEDYLKIWQYIHTNPAQWKDDCFYLE